MISSDATEGDKPEVLLTPRFGRVFLFFLLLQGGLMGMIAGLAVGAGLQMGEVAWFVGVGITILPSFTAAMAWFLSGMAAGSKGLYTKAPKSLDHLDRWDRQLIPWRDVKSVHPSMLGFKLVYKNGWNNMLPPFCFENWERFEALLRKHRPDFFKD